MINVAHIDLFYSRPQRVNHRGCRSHKHLSLYKIIPSHCHASCLPLDDPRAGLSSLWPQSGLDEVSWDLALAQLSVDLLSALLTSLDGETISLEISAQPALVPALVAALSSPDNATQSKALAFFVLLLAQDSFRKGDAASRGAAELSLLLMDCLGLTNFDYISAPLGVFSPPGASKRFSPLSSQ